MSKRALAYLISAIAAVAVVAVLVLSSLDDSTHRMSDGSMMNGQRMTHTMPNGDHMSGMDMDR